MARTKTTMRVRTTGLPSAVTDDYWIYARRKIGKYPAFTDRGGKWLVFVPLSAIDDVWEKIKKATEDGLLGCSAKVSTRRPNPNSSSNDRHVICVYTYDGDDEEDVHRVREALRTLGVISKIPWKSDDATLAGQYANRGDRRISRYYE